MNRVILLLLIVLVLELLAGCTAGITQREPTPAPPQVIVDSGHQWPELDDPIEVNPVLLVFTMPNCGPCKRDKPTVEKIGREGKIDVIYVDVFKSRSLMEEYGVTLAPTYLVIDEHFGELIRTNDVQEIVYFNGEL